MADFQFFALITQLTVCSNTGKEFAIFSQPLFSSLYGHIYKLHYKYTCSMYYSMESDRDWEQGINNNNMFIELDA